MNQGVAVLMAEKKPWAGIVGIGIGAAALLLALVHFYAGPFAPQPSLEQTVAEKAVAIRDATVAALSGEEYEDASQQARQFDADRVASVATAVLGGLAVILAVVAVALGEPYRVAGGAVFLGVAALAFQFFALALGVLVLAILIAAVLGSLGINL